MGRPAILRLAHRTVKPGERTPWRVASQPCGLDDDISKWCGDHYMGVVGDGREPRRLRLRSFGLTENVGVAALLATDTRETAAGQTDFVSERGPYTHRRRRVELVAQHLGADREIVKISFEVATFSHHPFLGAEPGHRATACRRIRAGLGYAGRWSVAQGIGRTAEWLPGLDHEANLELEHQLGDPVDYASGDVLLAAWDGVPSGLRAGAAPPAVGLSPSYRHQTQPNEARTRREFIKPAH